MLRRALDLAVPAAQLPALARWVERGPARGVLRQLAVAISQAQPLQSTACRASGWRRNSGHGMLPPASPLTRLLASLEGAPHLSALRLSIARDSQGGGQWEEEEEEPEPEILIRGQDVRLLQLRRWGDWRA